MRSPPWERRHEIVDGQIVRKDAASAKHGAAQSMLVAKIVGLYRRARTLAGGWWLATGAEVRLEAHEIYRPE